MRAACCRLEIASSLAIVAMVPACTDPGLEQARQVVHDFCAEVAAGRVERARAFLVAAERTETNQRLQPEGLRAGYTVGAARAENGHVLVPLTTTGAADPVTFVLLREDGGWRISLAASMHATLGARLERVRKVIDGAGKQMVERFQQAQQQPPGQPASPPMGR